SGAAAQAPDPNPKDRPFTTRFPNIPPLHTEFNGTPTALCTDPRGCPDLYVLQASLNDWDAVLRTFTASSCAVHEGYAQPGHNLLLRFTYPPPNQGQGDLIIGAPADHPDWFTWSNCHGHSHFKEYADYRLWTVAGYQAWTALRAANP